MAEAKGESYFFLYPAGHLGLMKGRTENTSIFHFYLQIISAICQ